MPRFDASNSSCHVFTRRAGVLGAMGHDLELAVGTFWIEVDEATQRVSAELDAR